MAERVVNLSSLGGPAAKEIVRRLERSRQALPAAQPAFTILRNPSNKEERAVPCWRKFPLRNISSHQT